MHGDCIFDLNKHYLSSKANDVKSAQTYPICRDHTATGFVLFNVAFAQPNLISYLCDQ